jgi:hypothetical protein
MFLDLGRSGMLRPVLKHGFLRANSSTDLVPMMMRDHYHSREKKTFV